jgi:predicted phage tail protein
MDPLAAPVLTTPLDGALLYPNLTLSWDAVVNAAQYQLQVATDSAFTDRVFNGKIIDTFQDLNDLAPGKYYWRVKAIEEGGLKGTWSVVRGFTVTRIFPPVLTSPDNEATVGPDVTLSWDAVDNAVQYKLQVSKDAAFTKLIVSEKTTELSKALTGLGARNYYWRVKAIDADGFKSPWSEVWMFTVVP